MFIKFKAYFYRLTGVYLAYKEEKYFMRSDAFWKGFHDIAENEKDMNYRDIYGLLIGMWQAKHGFTKPYKLRYRSYPNKKRKK